MLKQHSQLILALLVAADACAVSVAWLAAYWLRFAMLPVDPAKGVPGLADKYLPMLPLIVAAHLIIFWRLHLYRPRREGSIRREIQDIAKAFLAAIVAVVLIDYAMPASNKISRSFTATYAVVGAGCFGVFRLTIRLTLRYLRRRGFNRRSAAVVGTGRAAQRLLDALQKNSWTGLDVTYFVAEGPERAERQTSLRGIRVAGELSQLREILEREPVDAVFIALANEHSPHVDRCLAQLETCMADVRLVPELNRNYAMRPNVSSLDGVPILSLRQTPLYGWNGVVKRAFDVTVGAICLLIAAPAMGLIALLVKLTSPGPVFYRQRRMGLDGREFDLIKFRTMVVDAERETGAVWARRNDPRRTPIGAFLRRTSLDELPNLFNVLAGHMSLVGPRPERPELIARFKQEIPNYMLRHKMKAGMTGYAQIRGYRGDTSLRKRIQHDVHYIRHWSLGLDVRILLQTVAGVWFSRHET